jgi:methylated-DNA-[protein]-cysteine S-methyltransferase
VKYCFQYPTPVGTLHIAEESGAITDIRFHPVSDAETLETALLKLAAEQLFEYFEGRRYLFELPLNAKGTSFQRTVWNTLIQIPYGETRSYKELAAVAGNAKACRAVGMANNKNPISIVIPCHRVIGANGRLVGYGGGLDIKSTLLELEQRYK